MIVTYLEGKPEIENQENRDYAAGSFFLSGFESLPMSSSKTAPVWSLGLENCACLPPCGISGYNCARTPP
jgi:hypothetical protein